MNARRAAQKRIEDREAEAVAAKQNAASKQQSRASVDYRPYTLDDFKRLPSKKALDLAGLGPSRPLEEVEAAVRSLPTFFCLLSRVCLPPCLRSARLRLPAACRLVL